jgi:CheY-like chemotaxis protein
MLSILFIDDYPDGCSRYLANRTTNAKIDFASNIEMAIKKLKDREYNVIVLDLLLPTGNLPEQFQCIFEDKDIYHWTYSGITLLKILKSGTLSQLLGRTGLECIPVIVFSAASSFTRIEAEIEANFTRIEAEIETKIGKKQGEITLDKLAIFLDKPCSVETLKETIENLSGSKLW